MEQSKELDQLRDQRERDSQLFEEEKKRYQLYIEKKEEELQLSHQQLEEKETVTSVSEDITYSISNDPVNERYSSRYSLHMFIICLLSLSVSTDNKVEAGDMSITEEQSLSTESECTVYSQ